MKLILLRGLPRKNGVKPCLGVVMVNGNTESVIGIDMGPYGLFRFVRQWWPLPVIVAEQFPPAASQEAKEGMAALELQRIIVSDGILYYDRAIIGPVIEMKIRWKPVPRAPWAFQSPEYRKQAIERFRAADVRCTPTGILKALPRRS